MELIKFDNQKYDLKKLIDPKHPFLERFRDKAPGTYKHCQNVAGLCESVAVELDIDPTLMRVLGMFHDAGKITFPECFYENQNGSGNIHDNITDPLISFHLLSKHISDSALILIQIEDFPFELIKPITQHHGNTIIKTIANKTQLEEDMFRYRNTSPPTTLEAAILMICDSVEATIRGKEYEKNKEDKTINLNDIENIIRNTIERLESDDQLDEIKLGDLKKIKKALKRDLESQYHKRDSKAYDEE